MTRVLSPSCAFLNFLNKEYISRLFANTFFVKEVFGIWLWNQGQDQDQDQGQDQDQNQDQSQNQSQNQNQNPKKIKTIFFGSTHNL